MRFQGSPERYDERAMITVRITRNIFSGEYGCSRINGPKTAKELKEELGISSARLFRNGEQLEDGDAVNDGDFVIAVIVPEGAAFLGVMSILSIVASVVLAAVSIGLVTSIPSQKKLQTNPSLRGSTNSARKNQMIPILLGRYRVYPDIAALPYSVYRENDQYLRQLFCFGYKSVSIDTDTLKIGETPVTRYKGYTIPDDPGGIYSARCIESSVSLRLTNDGTPEAIERTTASNTWKIAVGLVAPSGLHGEDGAVSIGIRIEWRISGGEVWTAAVDETVSADSDKWRKLYEITVPDTGTYDIRVSRTTKESGNASVIDTIYLDFIQSWTEDSAGNRAPVNGSSRFSLLGLELKATDQLNGIIDELNAVCTLRSRVYKGTGTGPSAWEEGDAVNPASAILYLLTDPYANPSPLTDDEIVWDEFEAFYRFCDEHGFECNAYISSEEYSIGDIIGYIASSNLAEIRRAGRKIGIIIDAAISHYTQLFTPRNAWDFSVSRTFGDDVRYFRIKYIDASIGYEETERIVSLSSDGTIVFDAEIPEDESGTEISLVGVTDPEHAAYVGRQRLREISRQRRTFTWTSDIEGILCVPGDVVLLAHSQFSIGLGEGRIKKLIRNNGILEGIELDTELPFEDGKSYSMIIRSGEDISSPLSIGDHDGKIIYLSTEPEQEISIGDLCAIGETAAAVPVQITSIERDADGSCRITAVDYDASVYAEGEIPPYDPGISKHPDAGSIGIGASNPGAAGPQGPQGEKGDKGDTGAQGPQGETGPAGPQGEKGETGDAGPQGPQGEKGDKGDTGAQGPQGEKGETGAQGPQGNKGDAGIDGDSLSLSVVSASDRFTLSWTGNPSPESQTIEFEAFSKYIAAESITWACSEGELSAVSGNAYRRTLSISSISDDALSSGASIKIQVSGVTAQSTSLVSTLFISVIKAENPVPIYCGMVDLSSDSVTNHARQEGIYAPGDYVFYSGNSNESYLYGNIYEWNGSSWEMSNTSAHTFGAMEDLVDSADSGAETTPFQIISNLIVSRLVGDYLTIRNANIKEKLTVDKISGKDENGIGFELTKDGISATKRDENGNIVSSWEFRSDGSGSIQNLNILGKLIASSINHEALITQSATAFGESGQKSYQKDFPKDLWSRSKMFSRIQSLGVNGCPMNMEEVSGASYGGKTITKIGLSFSDLPFTDTPRTNTSTDSSIMYGTYSGSFGVAAGGSYAPIGSLVNNTERDCFIEAKGSLNGSMNYLKLEIYKPDNSLFLSLGEKGFIALFILPKGWKIKITAGSNAWWGNRTATYTLAVSPSLYSPIISDIYSIDDVSYEGDDVSHDYQIAIINIPEGAKRLCLINTIDNFYSGTQVRSYFIKFGEEEIVDNYAADSRAYIDCSRFAGKNNVLLYARTNPYSNVLPGFMARNMKYFFLANDSDKNGFVFEYDDGTYESIDASSSPDICLDWDINRFIYSSYDSAAYLEKISGTTVCSWLDSQGFTAGAQFSTNQGEDSSLTIDTDSYGVSQGTRLISILRTSYSYQVLMNGAAVNIYQLDGAVSAAYGFYDALSFLFYPLASESKILTRNIEPQQNITFDIGTLEKMFRHIYAQGMTLGEEGEDWLIEDNEGYVTLPNGLKICWKEIKSSDSHIQIFGGRSYSVPPVVICTRGGTTDSWHPEHYPCVANNVTTTQFYYNCGEWRTGLRYYWIAIGY